MNRRIGILLVGVALGLVVVVGVRSLFDSALDVPVAPADGAPGGRVGPVGATGAIGSIGSIGATEYARRLEKLAGAPLAPAELTRIAAGLREELERRLDGVARELDAGAADWRPVFERLRSDAPATEAEVLALYHEEVARAEEFFRARAVVPMPAESPAIRAIDNPAFRRLFPLALLLEDGTLGVTTRAPDAGRPAGDDLANQCRVCVPPVVVHETYPGHHVAFAAMRGESSRVGAAAQPYFHEGWAQYAELLAAELGYWRGEPERELGALRLTLVRVLRAEGDVALHGGGWSGEELRRRYREIALVSVAAAEAELAGHLQAPGRKAAYLVGALQVLALRARLGEPRGADLLAFHARLLERPATLPEIARERFGVELGPLPERLPPAAGAR